MTDLVWCACCGKQGYVSPTKAKSLGGYRRLPLGWLFLYRYVELDFVCSERCARLLHQRDLAWRRKLYRAHSRRVANFKLTNQADFSTKLMGPS